jgi:cyclohexanone monooxygenase
MSDYDRFSSATSDTGLDILGLRRLYAAERYKRFRSDRNEQYIAPSDELAHFDSDPYVESGYSRPPISDEVNVILAGGGFAGVQRGANLRNAGVEKVRIVERGGHFRGIWYGHRCSGAQCDVESFICLPLLEERRSRKAPWLSLSAITDRGSRGSSRYSRTCATAGT